MVQVKLRVTLRRPSGDFTVVAGFFMGVGPGNMQAAELVVALMLVHELVPPHKDAAPSPSAPAAPATPPGG